VALEKYLGAFLKSYLGAFLMSYLGVNEYPPATIGLVSPHTPGGLAIGMRQHHPLNMIHFLFWRAMANCGAR